MSTSPSPPHVPNLDRVLEEVFGVGALSDPDLNNDAVRAWLKEALAAVLVTEYLGSVILRRHYGLGGEPPQLLAVIARSLGLSNKERARHREALALRQIRALWRKRSKATGGVTR